MRIQLLPDRSWHPSRLRHTFLVTFDSNIPYMNDSKSCRLQLQRPVELDGAEMLSEGKFSGVTTHAAGHTSAQNHGLHCIFVFGVQYDPRSGVKPSINESKSLAYRDHLKIPMFERVMGKLPVLTTMCIVQGVDRQVVWHLPHSKTSSHVETLLTVSTFCTRVQYCTSKTEDLRNVGVPTWKRKDSLEVSKIKQSFGTPHPHHSHTAADRLDMLPNVNAVTAVSSNVLYSRM